MKEIIVILFLIVNVVLGVYSQMGKNKIKNESDMNLSGRNMGWFTLGASAAASGCSAFAFVGMAAAAYTTGVSMIWYAALACTWSWGVFYIMGKRLRRMSVKTETTTIVDYLSVRLGDNKGIFRTVAAIIVIVFMLSYMASNFSAIASAFQSYLGWPTLVGLAIGALIVAFYSAIGGFKGVVLIDTLQAIVMLLGSGVLLVFILMRAGGLPELLESAAAIDPNLVTVTGGKEAGPFIAFLASWLGSGLMGFGNPHISVRAMGMKDDKSMRAAGIWSYVINVWVMYMGVFSGLAARVWLGDLNNPDLAYGMIVGELVGPIIGGIIIAGIISATMSTVSSQLLVASSEASRCFFNFTKMKLSDMGKVRFARIVIIVFTCVALVVAQNGGELVYYGILFAWAGLGCAFGPILVLSLFWKRMTLGGGMAGMLLGTLTVVVWKLSGLSVAVYEGLPGLIIAVVAAVVVSLLTKPPKDADALVEYAKN